MNDSRPGRNERCACGSDRKYKHCCGREGVRVASPAAATDASVIARVAALANSGRHAEMEAVARGLIADHPNSGFAWKALGVALQMQGKDALQALEKAAALQPTDADCHSNLGSELRRRGRLVEAEASYRIALTRKPQMAEIWNNLGNVLKEIGRLDDAVSAYRKALGLKPGFPHPHNNLGGIWQLLGRAEDAAASYREAISLDPAYADAHVNLGIVLRLENQSAAALDSCETALRLSPRLAAAWRLRAELHSDQGDFDAAEAALAQALAIEPNSPEAWAGIAGLRRMTSDDVAWLAEAQRLATQCTGLQEAHLRYALGKYYDDVGDYDQAFGNYHRANELAAASRPRHDRNRVSQAVDQIVRGYHQAWLGGVEGGNFSDKPVLIVGMPRSGTTLAEQILAAHPAVFGCGELSFWNSAASRHAASPVADGAAAETSRRLAEEYLAELNKCSAEASRVVDKMPGNFLYLGLIHAVLPRARIIHMRRHPIDTCLSIYFQNFGAAHPYANSLDDLAHYYRAYARVMDHWRAVLPPNALLEVPYEGLVGDPESWSRRMLDFVGLSWNPICLEFHGNRRLVNTFSKWQARQKISTTSVGRWRRYASWLGPLHELVD
jgi:tetratricopeptide (TPR) repeat protein